MEYLYIARFLDVDHVKVGVISDISFIESIVSEETPFVLDTKNIDFLKGKDRQVSRILAYIRIQFSNKTWRDNATDDVFIFSAEHKILELISQQAEFMSIKDLQLYKRN